MQTSAAPATGIEWLDSTRHDITGMEKGLGDHFAPRSKINAKAAKRNAPADLTQIDPMQDNNAEQSLIQLFDVETGQLKLQRNGSAAD